MTLAWSIGTIRSALTITAKLARTTALHGCGAITPKPRLVPEPLLLCVVFFSVPALHGSEVRHFTLVVAPAALLAALGWSRAGCALRWPALSSGLQASVLLVPLLAFVYTRDVSSNLVGSRSLKSTPQLSDHRQSMMPSNAVILYERDYRPWVYGVGRLFRFVHRNRNIKEIGIDKGQSLAQKLTQVPRRPPSSIFYFTYDGQWEPHWRDESERARAKLVAVNR